VGLELVSAIRPHTVYLNLSRNSLETLVSYKNVGAIRACQGTKVAFVRPIPSESNVVQNGDDLL
jgi:hypothetical protein